MSDEEKLMHWYRSLDSIRSLMENAQDEYAQDEYAQELDAFEKEFGFELREQYE